LKPQSDCNLMVVWAIFKSEKQAYWRKKFGKTIEDVGEARWNGLKKEDVVVRDFWRQINGIS